MRYLVWLLLLLAPVRAQDLPDPVSFGQSDSLAICVVRARADDPGFRQMLSTALQGAQGSGAGSLAGLISSFLSLSSQEAVLFSALPLQWVRVDRQGPRGGLLSNVAITLKGWRGFQSLIYEALTEGPDGQPFETRRHSGEDIVLRAGWQNPALRMVIARVEGTFLNCATVEEARYLIDRLTGKDTHELSGPLWQLYAGMPHDQDAYGAIVNRDGTMLKVLSWVNSYETNRVRRAVGAERLEQVAGLVETVTWEADVVSDDRIDIRVSFRTANRARAEDVAALVEEAREVLEQGGRMGEFFLTTHPDGVKVGFAMIGFQDFVRAYLGTVKL